MRQYKTPLVCYLLFILSVFTLQHFFDPGTVFSISAALMLVIPFLANTEYNYFYFNFRGFSRGVLISLGVLSAYFLVLFLYGLASGKVPGIKDTGYSFFLIQLLLVAIPEEVFFRGYLQRQLGNNIRAIVIVSVLFAIAHLLIVCTATGNPAVCAQNALTFFPSLVMGYLFYKTGTIWSSIFFHFFANILHILLKFS